MTAPPEYDLTLLRHKLAKLNRKAGVDPDEWVDDDPQSSLPARRRLYGEPLTAEGGQTLSEFLRQGRRAA